MVVDYPMKDGPRKIEGGTPEVYNISLPEMATFLSGGCYDRIYESPSEVQLRRNRTLEFDHPSTGRFQVSQRDIGKFMSGGF